MIIFLQTDLFVIDTAGASVTIDTITDTIDTCLGQKSFSVRHNAIPPLSPFMPAIFH